MSIPLSPGGWTSLQNLPVREYNCGSCGRDVASDKGYHFNAGSGKPAGYIFICPMCKNPTLFYKTDQTPGPVLGRGINHLPEDIALVYNEIRDSIKNNCYTSSILLGRKLIMHLSANKAGTKANSNFKQHINALKNNGYIPPNADKLLEFIRNLGNEQNHQIVIGEATSSRKMLKFIEVLLIFIYEMPKEFADDEDDEKDEKT